jgi:DNA-directed RNA polymerase specialized sigma24 family protein
LKNFLFVYARSCAIDILQARRTRCEEQTHESYSECMAHKDSATNADQLFAGLVKDIVTVIQNMPNIRGQVFRMIYLEQLSPQQVSQVLGISVEDVNKHVNEAYKETHDSLIKIPRKHLQIP